MTNICVTCIFSKRNLLFIANHCTANNEFNFVFKNFVQCCAVPISRNYLCMIIQTYFSMSFSYYFMRCYQDKVCLADHVVTSFHASHASTEFSLGVDVLVSNNVQWSMGKSTFAVTMGQHTKPPVRGLHILNMLLSVFKYVRLGLGLILKTAGG